MVEKIRVIIAATRSCCGVRVPVLDVLPPPILLSKKANRIHGTSVSKMPVNVCRIVHGDWSFSRGSAGCGCPGGMYGAYAGNLLKFSLSRSGSIKSFSNCYGRRSGAVHHAL